MKSSLQRQRDANFDVCNRALPLVQHGLTDFDPLAKVLYCDKPGTGCGDAPSVCPKLRKATQSFGLKSSLVNRVWKDGELQLVILKHEHDTKLGGTKHTIEQFVSHLSADASAPPTRPCSGVVLIQKGLPWTPSAKRLCIWGCVGCWACADDKCAGTAVAPVLRAPAECSMLVSLAWLREKLQTKELDRLY